MAERVLAGVAERDFAQYPKSELDDLFTIPEYQPVAERLDAYEEDLTNAGYDSREIAVVAHAVGSYLDIQQQKGNEHIAAQALLISPIDPYKARAEGEKETLISVWERKHSTRNARCTKDLREQMNDADNGGDPVSEIEFGGMFSAKTDKLLEFIVSSQQLLPGGTVLHPFIARVLDERYIMSRRGGKGRGHDAEEVRRLKAMRVSYSQLQRRLLYAAEHKNGSRNLVGIDEISFIPNGLTEARALVQTLLYLRGERIHVIGTGLDTNYRDEPLAFAVAVDEVAPWMRTNNDAFFAYYDEEGKIRYRGGATKTMRHLTKSGFADFTLPVPIGRVYSHLVKYSAQSEEFHPFTVLRAEDPVAIAQLNTVQEHFAFETENGEDDHRLFSYLLAG